MVALSVCWSISASAQLGARAEPSPPANPTPPEKLNARIRWVLREGTSVGPIVGRISSSGNQWRFVPDEVNTPIDEAAQDGALPPGTTLPLGARPVAGREKKSLLNKSAATKPDAVAVDSSTGSSNPSPAIVAALSSILVVENLMLQRVVDAIEENPTDARWRITGVVTEFRDENRLILKTIERAPATLKPR